MKLNNMQIARQLKVIRPSHHNHLQSTIAIATIWFIGWTMFIQCQSRVRAVKKVERMLIGWNVTSECDAGTSDLRRTRLGFVDETRASQNGTNGEARLAPLWNPRHAESQNRVVEPLFRPPVWPTGLDAATRIAIR